MIEAFIFDVDGTLIDSVGAHAESWVKTFEQYGKKIEVNKAKKLIGMGGDQFLPDYFSKKELAENEDEIEKYRSDLFKKVFMPRVESFPKVRELFQKIRAEGKQIVLASSAKKDEVEAYKKIADIEDLIDEETSTDDAEESKPEPDILKAVLRKIKNVEKKNVVTIGDTPYDAITAKKAGLTNIVGVCNGGWSREELLKAGCLKVYENVAEIYENYENL